ncbi:MULTISPECIES: proline racemase family protein [Acinetobacter calcoaceticus/baumannii complex]|uniref:proline racemase family protein n=1 Tax=Acinetobacter calcoaceticus/baumannii complex TaxID=909768 RepID=UPI00244C8FE3|nr:MULTISPECIES: proline racemase family protein [Acinetobacter calcoaceticus/baumannii complex]MDH2595927.1 proline racemase family protein [Acinetobacter baumannii]MDO7536698.1 proline racemase family protein [Acinetobacter pittii]
MENYPNIDVVDMHTGGEPLRIITEGYPDIEGNTILEKRRYVTQHLDHLRKFLMFEPRGHKEMYGALLVEPSLPEADLAVLFMHNEGYSTMCGHAVIALGRFAIDEGLVEKTFPKTTVNIECPCGLVQVEVDPNTYETSFISVPAFALLLDQEVELDNGVKVKVDISYGGAFYALVEDHVLGLDIEKDSVEKLTHAADAVTQKAKAQIKLTHPDSDDLAFLYGTIITDSNLPLKKPSKNICIFADAQVDRSPTGSGVTARMAQAYARNIYTIGEEANFKSIVNSEFKAEVHSTANLEGLNAVHVKVSGKGFYTGRSSFVYDEGDELGKGFLCR